MNWRRMSETFMRFPVTGAHAPGRPPNSGEIKTLEYIAAIAGISDQRILVWRGDGPSSALRPELRSLPVTRVRRASARDARPRVRIRARSGSGCAAHDRG